MNNTFRIAAGSVAAFVGIGLLITSVEAGGIRGGGGGRPGGGGARPGGGGISRPSPNISRPSPNISRPSPNISRPSPNISRPSPNISRPSPQIARPSTPQFKPSIHDFNRPSTLPGTRPGGGSSLPDFGSRPGGDFANRPGNVTRPGSGIGTVKPPPSFNKPTTRPGGDLTFGPGNRPSTGKVEDFLGMHERPSTLPAIRPGQGGGGIQRPATRPTRPGQGDFRPGIVDRPGQGTRPGQGGAGERWPDLKPGGGGTRPTRPDRPINIGDISNIGHRPGWSNNLRPDRDININNNINNIVNRPTMNNWINNHPNRWDHWQNWGHGVADRWPGYNHGWFNNNWWHNHPSSHCWWHYHGAWGHRPWSYWWRYPSWGQVTTWFPTYGWNSGAFYDYGTGGNVVYQDNSVYIDGQQVASAAEYAQSAAALATVNYPAEPDEAQAAKMEWLPLGTFAISANENDKETTKTIQLAVNQDGVVTGTYYNQLTDKTYPVQGKVDMQTQRVAFTIGSNNDVVMETGIFNLTQDTAPALVHHGTEQTDTYLLVRLDPPQEESTGGTSLLP